MAKIDLKNAEIRLKDGTTGAGAVDNVGGYAADATSMTIDGVTGEIMNNRTFTVVGSTLTHTINSHTPSSGNTTGIVFTPGLDGSVADGAVITFGPNRLDIKIGEGNLTYSEKRNMEYVKDRGVLDTVREGDEEAIDIKFDAVWEFLKATTGSELPTVEDVLKNEGEAAAWVTSSADPCEPFALDLEIEYDPPCSGEYREIILFPDFRYEELAHDLRQGQISVSGKSNATKPTITRAP